MINLVIDGNAREFRLTRINDAWSRTMEAQRCEGAIYSPPLPGATVPVFDPPPIYGRAILELLDLPTLRDNDLGLAPYAGASATPFAGITLMDSPTGDSFAVDTILPIRTTVGETVLDFYPGPTEYFDTINTLRVRLYSGQLVGDCANPGGARGTRRGAVL